MKTTLLSLGLALGLGLTLGCGGGGNDCDTLAKKLCEGKDDAYCQKTKTWLDSQMTGPNDEKLSAKEANMGCKMILGESAALDAYKKQVAEKIK